MKNLYTKIFVLKKYMEKTKEIPWNMKHRFHEANPKIPKIRQADCHTIRLVTGCESSGVERNRARGFLVQRRTSTRPPRAESRKEKEKNNKPQLWTKTSTKNHGQSNTTKASKSINQKCKVTLTKNTTHHVYHGLFEAKL